MSSELEDFIHFKSNKLHKVCFVTGRLDTKRSKGSKIYYNVGHKNSDGYIRVGCGALKKSAHRMKHRLLYWLRYGVIPPAGFEIDHIDHDRSNNRICNLQLLSRHENRCRRLTAPSGPKFSKPHITFICKLLAGTTLSDNYIANEVGVSRGTIRDIRTRRSRRKESKDYLWPHREH